MLHQIQYLGLQAAYHHDRAAKIFLKKVMALPYIPVEDVDEVFDRLVREANQNEALTNLLDYVRTTWILCNRWDPSTWSVYRRLVLIHLLHCHKIHNCGRVPMLVLNYQEV